MKLIEISLHYSWTLIALTCYMSQGKLCLEYFKDLVYCVTYIHTLALFLCEKTRQFRSSMKTN